MVKKLEVRYSVPGPVWSHVVLCRHCAGYVRWCGADGAPKLGDHPVVRHFSDLSGLGVLVFLSLLTAKGQVVVSIDATGFKDTRLTPTVIPWSAIRALWASSYRSRRPNQLAIAIDPAFKRGLSIRLGANLLRWANLSFGSVYQVDVGTLDAEPTKSHELLNPIFSK